MITKKLVTDVLIIGGGAAGCFAAYTLGKNLNVQVLIAEKANIKRSGCLAAGVNALNAYITERKTPMDYVDYARQDAEGIVREDLLLSMAKRVNHVTEVLEELGLVILKDEQGKYITRGTRNIKINGENIKPILAGAASGRKNVTVLNHVNITDYKVYKGRIWGAFGFDVNEEVFYDIDARAVLCATGGASGLYRPNNPGFSRHKMWYCPFNTGAGYAMGLAAGAEMTTFEMRFIALRCKDTIAPTGTIAQGVGAKQINALDEVYEERYGLTTSQRVYGTVMEKRKGRGPCYLRTQGISEDTEEELYRAYLNMAPSQTLRWLETSNGPSKKNVEIEGTEPYIVGGHTASGYWVNERRETTIKGLFAAGDVAGGCPQKYVTGALAEGEIAAEAILEQLKSENEPEIPQDAFENAEKKKKEYEAFLLRHSTCSEISQTQENKTKSVECSFYAGQRDLTAMSSSLGIEQAEEAMQKIMDEYAGGISTDYQYNEKSLALAAEQIENLESVCTRLRAENMDELLRIYEIRERLVVCKAVIAHLSARKETRWHSFAENTDYPQKSREWLKFVNSRMENGRIRILFRELSEGGVYEYLDSEK